MTNPDNIVRVRARNGGRASVYEANGWAQAYTSGLLEGNGVIQNTSADMNVLVGGSATKPDVVLAINPADYKIGLDLVGQQAIAITAPASNSRISAIVAYTDDLSLATTEDTVTGSPSSCGLIVVNGTASASPSEPTDNQIRTAITADGATGSQASYCVIATILVASNTTTITDSLITNKTAKLAGTGVVSSSNIDFRTFGDDYSGTEQETTQKWYGQTIYKKTIVIAPLPNNSARDYSHGISNYDRTCKIEAMMVNEGLTTTWAMPYEFVKNINISSTNIQVVTGMDLSAFSGIITLYYTKTA